MDDDHRFEVLRSVRLFDVVGEATPLVQVPQGYRGSCILHPDPTQSLYVTSNLFHCFGCGFGGDAVIWTMRRHGVDEETALARLRT